MTIQILLVIVAYAVDTILGAVILGVLILRLIVKGLWRLLTDINNHGKS